MKITIKGQPEGDYRLLDDTTFSDVIEILEQYAERSENPLLARLIRDLDKSPTISVVADETE